MGSKSPRIYSNLGSKHLGVCSNLCSKSLGVIIWVPKVQEYQFGFQKFGSTNLGSKSSGVLIWVPKVRESGSFNAGSKQLGILMLFPESLGALLLVPKYRSFIAGFKNPGVFNAGSKRSIPNV